MSDPMTPEVSDWMKHTDVEPPDARESAQQVMARLPEVRRRRRWWPFPVLYRKPHAATTDYEPDPITATHGPSPTVIGRTQTMFSPAKAITAGALVFALGGVLFIAQPFQPQSSVPGAEMEPPAAPVPFTSTYTWSNRSTLGSVETLEDGTKVSTGVGWMFTDRDASDPRFAGPLVLTMTDIEYPQAGGSVAVGGYRVETADGAWQQIPGANLAFEEDYDAWTSGTLPPAGNIQFYTFIGQGGYEGLTAVVQETWANGNVEFVGFIFEGDLWEAPEPWVPAG